MLHQLIKPAPHEDIAPIQAMIARWAEDFSHLQHLQQTAFAGDKRWQSQIDWMLDGLTDLRNEGRGLVDALGDR